MRYSDSDAFKAGLASNLQNRHPSADLNRLLKQAMIERFLARTESALQGQALLKGGYALELRYNNARATKDVDMFIHGLEPSVLEEALRDAAESQLDDYLVFRIESTRKEMPKGATIGGQRLRVVPMLSGRRFHPFPLDVVVGGTPPVRTDLLTGRIDLSFAELPRLQVSAIPLEAHLAEKLHALSAPRPQGRLNTRVKDIVDVVLMSVHGFPPMPALRKAIAATFGERDSHPFPDTIDIPLPEWALEYRHFALNLGLTEHTLTVYNANEVLASLVSSIHSET